MKKLYLFIFVILLVLAVLVLSASRLFLPQLLSFYFGKQLKAEVRIAEASWSLKEGIKAKAVSISNKRGLKCDIESANIRTNFQIPSPLKGERVRVRGPYPIIFNLSKVELSYPESAVVSSIAEALYVKQTDLFRFDTASGRLYPGRKEFIVKELKALGEHIRLFIDATIVEDSRINASFRILLSGELIAGIPESTRKLFFKEDGSWSKVELYISGDIQRPSINFSTDLFKLIVR